MADKKAIIIRHNGGELGNQLWNAMSIYAFALEEDRAFSNWTFFEYEKLFLKEESVPFPIRTFFYAGFDHAPKFIKKAYKAFSKLCVGILGDKVLRSGNSPFIEGPHYLPPTRSIETDLDAIYFDGWMFRNPVGLSKYRKEILERFEFRGEYRKCPQKLIRDLRAKFDIVIGVHIRLGDYRSFKNGKYFVDAKRFADIAKEFISIYKLDKTKVAFIICSNERINRSLFDGVNTEQTDFSPAEDLHALSLCDAVIGSDSSFGALAAYRGDIPHIVATKEPIDWAYYRDKERFFFGKYSTVIGF